MIFFAHSAASQTGPVKLKKKKKKAVGTLSVTRMLRKFQREKEKERQKRATCPCPADAAGGGVLAMTDPLLSLIGSTNDQALIQAADTLEFDIDLDSLLEVNEDTLLPKALPPPEVQPLQPADGPTPLSLKAPNTKSQLQPKSEQEQTSPQPCVPLPEGLRPGLEEAIQRLLLVRF